MFCIIQKKRSETNSLLISDQYKIDNIKFNISNINNTKDYFQLYFWNKNTNEKDLDLEKNNDDNINDGDLEKKYYKIKKKLNLKF